MLTPPECGNDQVADGIARHLQSLIGPDGSLACRVRSRVLESALACRLMELDRSVPQWYSRALRFLQRASSHPGLSPLDRILTAAVVGTVRRSDMDDLLWDFRHPAAARKRVLLDAVLLLTCNRIPQPKGLEDFSTTGAHSWKRLEMLACRSIHDQACTDDALALRPDEYDSLAKALDTDEVYNRNVLSQLLFVFALRPHAHYQRQVQRGTAALLRTQNSDGGFRITPTLDVCGAAECGLALSEACWHAAARRIAGRLAHHQLADGGWGFASGVGQSDTDSSASCLRLLQRAANPAHATILTNGERYLASMQNPDGGFPTYVNGAASESTPTGTIITVIAHMPDPSSRAITAAVHYLAQAQCQDGSFGRNWNLSEACSVFRVLEGVSAALNRRALLADAFTVARNILIQAVAYLLASQNDDGGWGYGADRTSDATSTGFALAALGSAARQIQVPHAPVAHGLAYLASVRTPDGTFSSPSHELIPRPIPADIPALTHARILRGIALTTPTRSQ